MSWPDRSHERRGLSDLFRAIDYVGAVKAVRQDYEVFRTEGGDFLVFRPSRRSSSSFHMTQVSAEKVEALKKIVGKESATSGSLLKDAKVADFFDTEDKVALRFELLMALYVLAALSFAEINRSGRNLVFTHKKTTE